MESFYNDRMNAPLLALTMGDPAGIGAEVIVGSWSDSQLKSTRRVVVGIPQVIERAVQLIDSPLQVRTIQHVDETYDATREIGVISIADPDDPLANINVVGQVSAACGAAAYRALEVATEWALAGDVDGIVTAPLNKESLRAAGHRFPGHTEILAEWCGVARHAMMLYLPSLAAATTTQASSDIGLGIIHTTLHVPLREVFSQLSPQAILDKCVLATEFVRMLLIADGLDRHERIAVAALNPHGGENGLFGDEEQRIIAPAVQTGIERGYHLTGPLPADTLMHRALGGEFDAVVAMYHDQGHIAIKLLGLDRAVNVTLGLPIVRTSVAHGTAFDIAWRGCASARSMVAACQTAARLAAAKKLQQETALNTPTV